MKKLFLAALLGCLWAAPSQAAVIYNWVPLSGTGQSNGLPIGLVGLGSLRFSDDVVASGHYSLVGTCHVGLPNNCDPGFYTRDFGDFKFFPWRGMLQIINVDFTVSFNPDGTLSGTTSFLDLGAEFHLSGSGFLWSGTFNADSVNCSDPSPCQATGYWQGPAIPAPEPLTLSLFGAGLAGAVALRRRRIAK